MKKKLKFLLISILLLILITLLFLFFLPNRFSPGNMKNINEVKTSCAIACSNNSESDYCSVLRIVNDGINAPFEETCYNLSINEEYKSRGYEITSCFKIICKDS